MIKFLTIAAIGFSMAGSMASASISKVDANDSVLMQDTKTNEVIQLSDLKPLVAGCQVVKTHENSPIPNGQTLKALSDIEIQNDKMRILIPEGTLFICMPKAG